jgi:hypothetical protein
MAVAELMRILLDDAKLGWDEAWDLTVRTLAYTNHTLLPEALEKWPVRLFELVCPRMLEIILRDQPPSSWPTSASAFRRRSRTRRVSLIEETDAPAGADGHLAIVGTHSTNGVAQIHSDLLRTRVVVDLRRDVSRALSTIKTNGVTPRRWLLLANPDLSGLITDAIGDAWVTDLSQSAQAVAAGRRRGFRASFRKAKQAAKERFATWLKATTGQTVNPDTIFDSQIKRIHEYKRQLLMPCTSSCFTTGCGPIPSWRCRRAPSSSPARPRPPIPGQASHQANQQRQPCIDADLATRGRIQVVFVPNYNVSLAERLIPASDVFSEQISTPGYEASGTGNMKFMMNGALTIGTRDGATIEMAGEAGEENFFLFGLTADEVQTAAAGTAALALRERTGNARGARPDIPGPLQPGRAGNFRTAPRDAPGSRGLLHAPGRLDVVRQGPSVRWGAFMPIRARGSAGRSSTWPTPENSPDDRTIAEYAADIWNCFAMSRGMRVSIGEFIVRSLAMFGKGKGQGTLDSHSGTRLAPLSKLEESLPCACGVTLSRGNSRRRNSPTKSRGRRCRLTALGREVYLRLVGSEPPGGTWTCET